MQSATNLDRGGLYGLWWLPAFPEKKVKGKLSWSNTRGGTLELASSFSDPDMEVLARAPVRPYTADAVLGEIEPTLTPYTLLNNLSTRLGPEPHFHSMYLIEGAHFSLVKDIKVRSASFRITHLEEWTGETPLERREESTAGTENDPLRLKLKRVTWKPMQVIQSTFSYPRQGTIELGTTFSPRFGFGAFTLEQKVRVAVGSSGEPFDFEAMLTCIHDCRNLFTLLMAEDAGIFDLWFSSESCETSHSYQDFHLLYPGLVDPAGSDGERHPDEMLLALPHIKNISLVVSKWMDEAPKLRRAADWLNASARTKGYSDTEFLNYVHAAETLHRVLMSSHFVGVEVYIVIEAALIAAIPPGTQNDLRQKLMQMLAHGNEFSLRRRLRALLGMIYPGASLKSHGNWINEIVETRNYFIHNDPESASRAASGQRLFELTCSLRGLVTAVLLQRVGVPLQPLLSALAWRGWYIAF